MIQSVLNYQIKQSRVSNLTTSDPIKTFLAYMFQTNYNDD